jgi:hypothetical protein
MESDVLEKAIQASKAEEPRQNGVPSRPPPPPVATPTDAPTWFAMLQGKQTGPLTRKEVEARTNGAEIGPRTYLWREGMSAWQRAKDVPELTGLFPQPPGPSLPPPLPAAPRTQPEPRKTPTGLERDARKPASPLPEGRNPAAPAVAPVAEVPAGKPLPDPAPSPLDPLLAHPPVPVVDDARATTAIEKKAAELAQWATEELARRSLPVGAQDPAERATMFESAAPERRSATFLVAVVLAILAAAALVLWVGLSERDRKENAPAEKSGLLRPEKRGRRA